VGLGQIGRGVPSRHAKRQPIDYDVARRRRIDPRLPAKLAFRCRLVTFSDRFGLMSSTKTPSDLIGSRHQVASDQHPISLGAGALALLCCVLWGGTTIAIRFSVDDLPPIGLAGLRFLLGATFMLAWCWWEGRSLRVERHQRVPILVTGVILFAQISLFNIGMQRTNAAHGSIFINSYPVFVAILAHHVLPDDRLTRRTAWGLAASTIGMTVVLLGPTRGPGTIGGGSVDQPTLAGDFWVLSSGMLLGFKLAYTKRALAIVEPGKLLFWHEAVAVGLFFATSAVVEGPAAYHFTTRATLGLLYQGLVVAGFVFALWTVLLRRHRASQLATFGFTTPLFGLAFSGLLRGDAITPSVILGGAGVAVGIYLSTTSSASIPDTTPGAEPEGSSVSPLVREVP
jgi:drug/metabolite transporter (DMT)-like permease